MFSYLVTAILGIIVLRWIYRFSTQDSSESASKDKFRVPINVRRSSKLVYSDEGRPLLIATANYKAATTFNNLYQLRSDDIFIVTYPKAGTTWMQEITWLLCNNADTIKAKEELVTIRVPSLEFEDKPGIAGFQTIVATPLSKQRIIKTHLPYDFLPTEVKRGGKCKIIYVARNPKDVCVSYYHFHHSNLVLPHPGNWETFLESFGYGKVCWGDWFEHNLAFWKLFQDKDERVYFVTYEDMKTDLLKELHGITKFLGKDLTEGQLETIAKHCTFDSMSKNNATNFSVFLSVTMDPKKSPFMRKGQIGDWKNHFTLNQNAAFDSLYKEKMKDSKLQMIFE